MTRIDWTFENTRNGYGNLWRSLKIKTGPDAANALRFAKLIVASEGAYKRVEKQIGVPWFFIGALHMRESSCNFSGVLHNGEKIIGKGKKTKLVPAGRGPFDSWEDAAVDALKLKGLEKIKDWSIERMGFEAERFNGLGYVGKAVNSAYLWAGSSHEQPGKYVADGVWGANFDDPQIGVMTVLKQLCALRADIAAVLEKPGAVVPPVAIEPSAPKPAEPAAQPNWFVRLLTAIFGRKA